MPKPKPSASETREWQQIVAKLTQHYGSAGEAAYALHVTDHTIRNWLRGHAIPNAGKQPMIRALYEDIVSR